MSHTNSPEMNALFEAILTMETAQECALFFEDLCTIKELQSLAQRWQVARFLAAGRNYNEVCADTGASSATISRVNKCLNYGAGGYRTALERVGGSTDAGNDSDQ